MAKAMRERASPAVHGRMGGYVFTLADGTSSDETPLPRRELALDETDDLQSEDSAERAIDHGSRSIR
jgi:hypothetical protein